MFTAIIGLGCSFTTYWLCYLQGPLLTLLAAAWHISPELLCLCFTAAMTVTAPLLTECLKLPTLRGRNYLLSFCTAFLMLAPLATAGAVRFYPEWGPMIGACLPAICGGAAQTILFVAWLERIGTYQFRRGIIIVGLAYAFAGAAASWGQTADYVSLLTAVTLLPLLSLAMLQRPVPPALLFTQDSPVSDKIHIIPLKLIIVLALIYTNGGILVHLLMMETSYLTLFRWSYLAYTFVCPAIGLLLCRGEIFDLWWLYRLLLPMSLIGFLIFSFQRDALTPLAFALLQGASALLNLYFWLLIPYFSRFSRRPAAVCAYGLFVSALCIISGSLVTEQFILPFLGAYGSQGLSFVACIISALLIFLFQGEKETFTGWSLLFAPTPAAIPDFPGLPDGQAAEARASKDFAAKFALSPRERDVLELLVRGRNGPYIREALNISENTVKTHIRNIYGKLGINSRQELLSLFETK